MHDAKPGSIRIRSKKNREEFPIKSSVLFNKFSKRDESHRSSSSKYEEVKWWGICKFWRLVCFDSVVWYPKHESKETQNKINE